MGIYDYLILLPAKVEGWHSEAPIFEKFITEHRPQHIIEVGTWLGASAIHMAKVCRELNLDTKITCVDTWLGSLEMVGDDNLMYKNGYPQVYYQFLSNIVHEGLQNVITPLPATSAIAAKHLSKKGVTADLIYIDASHEYEDVLADLKAYYPLANKVLFGDDLNWEGVKQAIDKFKPYVVEDGGMFWAYKK